MTAIQGAQEGLAMAGMGHPIIALHMGTLGGAGAEHRTAMLLGEPWLTGEAVLPQHQRHAIRQCSRQGGVGRFATMGLGGQMHHGRDVRG